MTRREAVGDRGGHKRHPAAWGLASGIALLATWGCSPTIEDGEGSFESGPGVSTAAEDDATGSSSGDETSDGVEDDGPAARCSEYLDCLGALDSQQLGAMRDAFGEGGSCYQTQSVDACNAQCDTALQALEAGGGGAGLPTECGGQPSEPENTDAACSDGKDNDNNGFIDCDDAACNGLGVSVCLSSGENTDVNCADGIDNDGDDFVDCDDFDCVPPLVTVCTTAEDNQAACSDGVDNDGDDFVDCDDFDCSMNPNVDCNREDTDALCDDGQDNDGDDFVDCDDFDCSMNDEITVCS